MTLLLQCVDKVEVERIMADLHEGTFGTHFSGHTMAKDLLRAGYYWSTIEDGQLLRSPESVEY